MINLQYGESWLMPSYEMDGGGGPQGTGGPPQAPRQGAPGSTLACGLEVVDPAAQAMLDQVRALWGDDDVVMEGGLVVDEILQVGVSFSFDLLKEVPEDHCGTVHVLSNDR